MEKRSMHKISVVTISFNCKNDIERTIKSVLSLDYPLVEYIIIDGASQDGTLDIIKKYSDKIDIIVSEPDHGIYNAMNKGICKASGDWIIFMNAGDCFHSPTCVSEIMEFTEIDTVILYGDIIRKQNNYSYLVPYIPLDRMKKQMAIRHQATFVRVSYHKEHMFDESYKSSGDYAFFYDAYMNQKVKFQYVPIIIADFDASGVSNTNYKRSFRENRRIWRVEKNWLFILKQEIRFILWDINIWKNNLFYSPSELASIKIKKLHKSGVKYIKFHN